MSDQRIVDLKKVTTWDNQPGFQAGRHRAAIEQGFDAYRRARGITDRLNHGELTNKAKRYLETLRARLILQGNLLVTAVEQDVVQRALEVVIDHVPRMVATTAIGKAASLDQRYSGVPRQVAGLFLPYRFRPATDFMTAAWARLLTDQVLVMALPTEILRLGRDIPPLQASQPYYPPELGNLDRLPDPGPRWLAEEVAASTGNTAIEIASLVRSLDRTVGEGRGSGASDWRRYDERMNWAVTLVRSRQQDPTLFWCPYSGADLDLLYKGKRPTTLGEPSDVPPQAPLAGILDRFA
jgi:hypothetical protein